MKATEVKTADGILDQLEREAPRTRRVLEKVPEGRDDWKPHEKSMPLGRLAMLVATMPSWVGFIVGKDELDVQPPAGQSNVDQRPIRTAKELVAAHDKAMSEAREVLRNATDEHLSKNWKLLAAGKVMAADPRHAVLRDTLMHLAHHRGQLTVYLRMNGAPVPSVYGPTADDPNFR
jgi:uncharacterized damage-inducible protein DinB